MEAAYRLAALCLLLLAGMGRAAAGKRRGRAPVRVRRPETGMGFLACVLLPAGAALLAYLLGDWLRPFRWSLPGWVRWSGAGAMLLGDILLFWAHRELGPHWSPLLEVYRDHQLVTSGPYRLVRHPMYTAWLLLSAGLSLLSANAVLAVTWIGGLLVVLAVRLPAEERMMVQAFGNAYREYQARTGALFPRRLGR
jgi:protein-S-isoprenylcysteine O-methyltransferase Ste14